MVSLPIPSQQGRRLEDIGSPVGALHPLVSDLTAGRLGAETLVHLDPDLRADSVPRLSGWRPSFGQVSSAQGHLGNQGVGPGDIFLFFGWFRQAERREGQQWRFVPGTSDIHSLFGWLQVGEIVAVNPTSIPALPVWMHDHPHVAFAAQMSIGNTLYLAADRLFDGRLPGAGCFDTWTPKLQLTASGRSRSVWRLPAWMNPSMGHVNLTYHSDPKRWNLDGDSTLLQSVAKGQEFVMDVGTSDQARNWLYQLIQQHA
jgi:Nucleotide modification associated domain 3